MDWVYFPFRFCPETVTTKSEYWQRGDTSCVIQTKTIESYDATKKMSLY